MIASGYYLLGSSSKGGLPYSSERDGFNYSPKQHPSCRSPVLRTALAPRRAWHGGDQVSGGAQRVREVVSGAHGLRLVRHESVQSRLRPRQRKVQPDVAVPERDELSLRQRDNQGHRGDHR